MEDIRIHQHEFDSSVTEASWSTESGSVEFTPRTGWFRESSGNFQTDSLRNVRGRDGFSERGNQSGNTYSDFQLYMWPQYVLHLYSGTLEQ